MNINHYHRLLQRQIRRSSHKIANTSNADDVSVTSESSTDYEKLFGLISHAYEEYDKAQLMTDRATKLMSEELMELNNQIRREAVSKIQESERKFKAIVENVPGVIFSWKFEGQKWNLFFLSDSMESLSGYSLSDFPKAVDKPFWHIIHPEDIDRVMDRTKDVYTLEYRICCADGSIRWVQEQGQVTPGKSVGTKWKEGVLVDITNQKLIENQLIEARDQAEVANRAKSEFLTNMSHELRTPMHGILSYTDLGIQNIDTISKEKILEYFRIIAQSGTRLLELLNDLLDLAKLEAQKIQFSYSREDVRETIEEVSREMMPLCTEAGVSLEIEEPSFATFADIDRNAIVQVITNLLSNAIRYSPEGKRVSINFAETEIALGDDARKVPALTVMVADQGIGIEEDELEDVFDKFIQSSKTQTGAGGTGLGLAICREIVKGHHGKIWAENNDEGGATFILVIPTHR